MEQVRRDHVVVVHAIVPDSDIVPPVRTWNPANRPDLPDPGTIVAAEQAADAVSTGKNIIPFDRVHVLLGLRFGHRARVVERQRRIVRLRQFGLERLRDRVNSAGADDIQHPVAGQARPSEGVGNDVSIGVDRIVERNHVPGRVRVLAEVTVAELVDRHGDQIRRAAAFEVSVLKGEEEECFISAVEHIGDIDGSADAATRVDLPSDLARPRSEREPAGIERLVAQEHEGATVKLVCAGLRDKVDHAIRSAPKFGGVAAALHLELLQALDADANKARIVPALAVRFGAVELFALTVQQAAPDARVALIPDDTRCQDDEGHRAPQSAAYEQRQIHDGLRRHDLAEIGSFRRQQRRRGSDLHGLVGSADGKLHVETDRCVHAHQHPGCLGFAEAGNLGHDCVRAHGKVEKGVQAVSTCRDGLSEPRI